MNIPSVKKDFPIFKRKINKKPIIYLDSSASSLKPQSVVDAINDYYTRFSVNIFRGVYTLSEEATARYEEARNETASFIGAGNPSEVVFVRNASEAMNLVASSWGRQNVKKGDEIVSTVMEHHANIVPWQEIAKEKGAKVKYFDITSDGYLDTRNLDALITKKTVMVCLTHISNVLGTINPIRQLVKKIKTLNPKTLVLVDAAQSVPHMNINVGDLGCDFLAFSGHKMLGPTGIGILWGRYDLLDSIPPYQFGGDMIKEVHLYGSTYKEPPHKFEAGTPHISGAIGLGAACKYLKKIGMENVRNHEKELTRYALSGLSTIKNLTVYGPKDSNDKGGVLAFSLKGIHPHDLASILNSDNVCVRSGHHCAMPLHERLGLPATTRASLYIYNDEEDVDALVEGVNKAKKIFGI